MAGYLNDNTLVLSRIWQAVDVTASRDLFGKLFNDQARVLFEFQPYTYKEWRDFSYGYTGDDVIGCVGYQLRMPDVVLLTKFDRLPRKEVRYTRHSIFERDGHRCQYCGERFAERDLNLDHVIPREQKGGTSWENIVCACVRCNSLKANRTPEQAGMRLLKKPVKPNWRPLVSVRMANIMKESWKPFLNAATWDVEVSGHKQAIAV